VPESVSTATSALAAQAAALTEAIPEEQWSDMRNGFPYCSACSRYITADHLQTERHLRRISQTAQDSMAEPKQQQGRKKSTEKHQKMVSSLTKEAVAEVPAAYLGTPWWQALPKRLEPCMPSKDVFDTDTGDEALVRPAGAMVVNCQALQGGQKVVVLKDYLDHELDPANERHPSNGFLVVWAGEVVQVLRIGETGSRESGWVYAEVVVGFPDKSPRSAGWLPRDIVETSWAK
jgi:hypothetical protein